MASSVFRLCKNGLTIPQSAKNIHISSELLQDPKLKKGPSETEKKVVMVLKFAAAFLPGVYIGSVMQKNGYLSPKKADKEDDKEAASNVLEEAAKKVKIPEVKIEEKKK